MATPTQQKMSLAEFEAFITRPENSDKIFELINGEIVRVPSNPYVSVIAARIITFLGMYLMQNKIPGYMSAEGGGYIVDGQILAPDAAYSTEFPNSEGFAESPPQLAVEVISNPNSNAEQADLRRKLTHYLNVNVVVWVVDYLMRTVEVYKAGQAVQRFGGDDTIPGGDVIPGLQLPVKDIFPDEEA